MASDLSFRSEVFFFIGQNNSKSFLFDRVRDANDVRSWFLEVKGSSAKVKVTHLHACMDEFLDDEIGDNIKLLPDLLRGLKKKESVLQDQASQDSFLFIQHEGVQLCVHICIHTACDLWL